MSLDPDLFRASCPSCGGFARLPGGRCAECMADLAEACLDCGASTLRLAEFCWRCGKALRSDRLKASATNMPEPVARRPVTVMFCDLVGSSELATSMDPEDFGEVLSECHMLVTRLVAAHDGFTARYMGDGTLAYFGYPQSGEDDAARAVSAGLAVLQAMPGVKILNRPIQVRIGIATGIVVVGDVVGVRGPRGLDVAGRVPNLAARLQSIAQPNTIVVDEAAHALTHRLFDCLPMGGVSLKGWAQLVHAWRVLRPAETLAESTGKFGAPALPLVGRYSEVGRLAALWRNALAGCGKAVVVVGEMGIGKSRLIDEVLREAVQTGHTSRRWFCSRYLQGVVLHPIVQQLERAAGIVAEDDQPARREKLNVFLAALSALERALIIELIAPGAAPPAVTGLPPGKRRDMTLDALLALMRARAAESPVFAVFEDYHWADPTSRALLALAVQNLSTIHGLLIVTARPGSEPDWSGQPGVERIELEALSHSDAARLAETVAQGALAPRMLNGIVARCDGVPLFIEEVTRASLEDSLHPTPSGAGSVPMPLSIHASLTARLDGLGSARATAEVASVIGREFAPTLLAQVMDRSMEDIRSDITMMLASGLIHGSGDVARGGFRFKHALIQDAAYDSMVRARRRALHGRVARAMRDLAPTEAQTQPQLLATHFTEAGEVESAITWWLAAGARSLQQSAMTEGLEQLERARDLLETQADSAWRRQTEMTLLICKAKAHVATSGHASDTVGENFRRARALCDSLPGTPQLLTVTFGEWSHYVTRGPLLNAARLAREIRRIAEQSGDVSHAMCGFYASGMTDTVMGHFVTAKDFLDRGLQACALLPAAAFTGSVGDPRAIMASYLSLIASFQGRDTESLHYTRLSLEAANETKLTYSIALALSLRSTIHAFGSVADGDDGNLDALRDFANTHGMVFFESIEICFRGWDMARRGAPAGGLRLLEEGLTKYLKTQSGVWIWSFLRMKAEILGWLGRMAEGLAILDEAEHAAARVDSQFETPIVARVRGELLVALGQRKPAIAAFARAEASAMRMSAPLFATQATDACRRLLGVDPNDEINAPQAATGLQATGSFA